MTQFILKHHGFASIAFRLRVFEPFLLVVSSFLAHWVATGRLFPATGYVGWTLAGMIAFGFAAHLLSIYRRSHIAYPLNGLTRLVSVIALSVGFVLILMFLTQSSHVYSRLWAVLWFVFAVALLFSLRLWAYSAIRTAVRKGLWQRNIALLGAGEKAQEIIHMIRATPSAGLSLTGVYTLDDSGEIAEEIRAERGLLRGGVDQLLVEGRQGGYDELIIVEPLDSVSGARGLLEKLRTLSVGVYYCLPLPMFGLVSGTAQSLDRLPLIMLMRKPLTGHQHAMKRALDLAAALPLLIPFALIYLVVAPLIKLSSDGPVFFSQKRRGLNGEEFAMLKFRSMRNAPPPLDADGKEKQATKDDPRITWIGRILRKTSLDETPQLLNVLRGDMSLVGPRPHAISHDDYYGQLIDSYTARHKMRPGITGWAQLMGARGETETLDKMEHRVDLDIWYTENWSLALDLKILFLTPFAILFHKKAY